MYPLLVAAMGERPLGIQAGQLAAVARWAQTLDLKRQGGITLVARGPRSSVAAPVAAAIEPGAIERLELSGAPATLCTLVEDDRTVETLPELFAFGLLAAFDVRELVALAAPRAVVFREPDERARRELAGLDAWYALFGARFEPCALSRCRAGRNPFFFPPLLAGRLRVLLAAFPRFGGTVCTGGISPPPAGEARGSHPINRCPQGDRVRFPARDRESGRGET